MKKAVFYYFLIIFLCSGCFFHNIDTDAENAVGEYIDYRLQNRPTAGKLSIEDVLAAAEKDEIFSIYETFYSFDSGEKSADSIARMEKRRLELNNLLGFLPEEKVEYDIHSVQEITGSFPEELPHIAAAEKAAMMINNGRRPLDELLFDVRKTHLFAIKIKDMMDNDSVDKEYMRKVYFRACVFLADAIGVGVDELSDLSEYEKRFDKVLFREKQALKSAK